MKKFNKRMGRSRSGVSDIIGNLLILAITVTLFSSIMFYVANMPEPAEATFTDLEPAPSNILEDDTIWVNITHKGGQTLKGWSTGIYIFVNGTLNSELQPVDGGVGEDWSTGEVWSYNVAFLNELTGLSIMIVDKDTNSIVWQTDLLGGVSNIQLAPIIGTRYTSPSPGLENRSLTIFVQVMDPNGDDITAVWLDLTTIGLGSGIAMDQVSQNLYSKKITDNANFDWDNRRITIYAKDETDRTSSALMTLIIDPTYSGGGDDGGGDGFENFDISGLQGFAIFEESEWNRLRLKANQTQVFFQDTQNAVVVMITKTVVNTLGKNELIVMNPSTKVVVAEVSSPAVKLKYFNFVAGYYIYNCTIDTTNLEGNYSLAATITDSKSSPDTFTFNSWIYVLTDEASTTEYPTIITYRDSTFSTQWSDFSISDSSLNKIYVEIRTENNGTYQIGSGNVEIRDFVWATQVKRSPAVATAAYPMNSWNGPVSNVWWGGTNGVYRFIINLANCTTGAEWLPLNNAYILRFDVFKTSSDTFLLNKVIHIDAPTTKYDIVASLQNPGGGNWATQSSLFYYVNDNSWLPPVILETTADRTVLASVVYKQEAGDINDDGLGDFVAIVAKAKVNKGTINVESIYPIIYTATTGSTFIKTILPPLMDVDGDPITDHPNEGMMADLGLSLGNIDQDDDLDILLAYDDRVFIYRNDGAWNSFRVATGVDGMIGVTLTDMDPPGSTGNDPQRSMDVVIVTTSTIIIYPNSDSSGTYDPSDMISLAASGEAEGVQDWALDEITYEGLISSGDYNYTRGDASQYYYEELFEETVYNTITTYPETAGANQTSSADGYLDMYEENDGDTFSIQPNYIMNIATWDNDLLNLPQGRIDVKMLLNYTATGYTVDGETSLKWYNASSGLYEDLIGINNGTHDLEIPLTMFSSALNIASFNVLFNNNNNGTLSIDMMKINITYTVGDSLNHVWTFQATAGEDYYFNVYAANSTSVDGDGFKFQYSKVGPDAIDTDWHDMVTISTVNPTTFDMFTSINLGDDLDGVVYIRVIDTGPGTSNPTNDWIKVSQMYLECTAQLTKLGKSIQAYDVADVDGDGFNDIVVCTVNQDKVSGSDAGDVWVLYNRQNITGSGIFVDANIKSIVLKQTSIGSNVKWLEVGRFFGGWNDAYLDMVVGVSITNLFYGLDQTAVGTFNSAGLIPLTFLSGMTVTDMIAVDIDGNNRCDLVFASRTTSGGTTSGHITIWANYGGTTAIGASPSVTRWAGYSWQRYQIDTINDSPIYDLAAGGVAV